MFVVVSGSGGGGGGGVTIVARADIFCDLVVVVVDVVVDALTLSLPCSRVLPLLLVADVLFVVIVDIALA